MRSRSKRRLRYCDDISWMISCLVKMSWFLTVRVTPLIFTRNVISEICESQWISFKFHGLHYFAWFSMVVMFVHWVRLQTAEPDITETIETKTLPTTRKKSWFRKYIWQGTVRIWTKDWWTLAVIAILLILWLYSFDKPKTVSLPSPGTTILMLLMTIRSQRYHSTVSDLWSEMAWNMYTNQTRWVSGLWTVSICLK